MGSGGTAGSALLVLILDYSRSETHGRPRTRRPRTSTGLRVRRGSVPSGRARSLAAATAAPWRLRRVNRRPYWRTTPHTNPLLGQREEILRTSPNRSGSPAEQPCSLTYSAVYCCDASLLHKESRQAPTVEMPKCVPKLSVVHMPSNVRQDMFAEVEDRSNGKDTAECKRQANVH